MSGKHSHGRKPRPGLSGWLRALATVLAAVALVFSAIALVFRVQPVSTIPRLVLSVGATFVPLIALTGLIMAVLSRRYVLAIMGVFLVTATVAIQVSWYYFGHAPNISQHKDIRVLASNIRYGRADPRQFVGLAKDSADVVTVAELTPEAVERFSQAGINDAFPYSILKPGPGASGIGMWSKYPISPYSAPGRRNVKMPAARVQIPGVENDPIIASVHVMSPVAGDENTIEDWAYGMAGAKAQLDNFAKEAGPGAVIIGGDYNSTPDMRQFRDLLTNGYKDAVQQTGSGYAPTFKADSWMPPVITID
ncbi:MAG: endonuclease/exonuclease/phosphatase family protein, partial [Mycobacterium sp.]|nr:endonuclease/exonuclease/phosphatase family protein [Mycobacterium sp.]